MHMMLYQEPMQCCFLQSGEFRRPDYDKMAKLLKQKIIFDGRNQYDKAKLISKGFEYYNIGE